MVVDAFDEAGVPIFRNHLAADQCDISEQLARLGSERRVGTSQALLLELKGALLKKGLQRRERFIPEREAAKSIAFLNEPNV